MGDAGRAAQTMEPATTTADGDPTSARPATNARLWVLVAALLPATIIFVACACFVFNHFYVRGPFLHDSGWYSFIIWRQGLLPNNPPMAHGLPDYCGIHVSILVSLASLLSNLFPGERVDYYCLFQGAIYAPLTLVVPVLVEGERRRTLGSATIVGVVSLVFATSGQVIACIGFPHYEILIVVGTCLLLAGLATGRTGVAWLGMAIAAGTREDGGFHAASVLGAVLACDLLRRPFPVPRRTVWTMGLVALGLGVVFFVVQKKLFQGANLFREEYLGNPPLSHLAGGAVGHRLGAFAEHARVVAFPLAATAAIAAVMRDARYLLGWAATSPWLLLNLFAHQELKAIFSIYTGFPFVASIFWVAAYSRIRPADPRRPFVVLASLGVASLASTVGLYSSLPAATVFVVKDMLVPRATNRQALLSFVRTVRRDRQAHGRLRVDAAVGSWLLDNAPASALVPWSPSGAIAGDALAFFGTSLGGSTLEFVEVAAFPDCGKIDHVGVFFCAKPGRPLPPEFRRTSLVAATTTLGPTGHRREDELSVSVDASPSDALAVFGPFLTLRPATYRATWDLEPGSCEAGDRNVHFDVAVDGGRVVAIKDADPTGRTSLTFEVAPPTPATRVELRTWSGSCPATLRDQWLTVEAD